MRAGWKIFTLAFVTLAISLAFGRWLVPDVVPVGYAEEAQASWAVLTAFALRAIELTATWVAALALAVTLGAWARSRLRHQFASHVTGRLSSPRKAQPPILTGSDEQSRNPFNRANRLGSATSATMAREAKAPAQ